MLWVILIVCVTAVKPAEGVLYNCSRATQYCQHSNVCDVRTGLCVCRQPFSGFDCHVNGFEPRPHCSLQCQNDGICLRDARLYGPRRPDYCLCPPEYFGATCQERRVSVSCGGTSINVTFTPVQPYWGVAYVGESPDATACRLVYERNDPNFLTTTFSQIIPLDASCNGSVEEIANGDVVHTRQLHIQFSSLFISTEDLVYDVTCTHSSRVIARTRTHDSDGSIDASIPSESQAQAQVQAQDQVQAWVPKDDGALLGARSPTVEKEKLANVSIQAGGTGSYVAVIKLLQTGSEILPPASSAVTIATPVTMVTLSLLFAVCL